MAYWKHTKAEHFPLKYRENLKDFVKQKYTFIKSAIVVSLFLQENIFFLPLKIVLFFTENQKNKVSKFFLLIFHPPNMLRWNYAKLFDQFMSDKHLQPLWQVEWLRRRLEFKFLRQKCVIMHLFILLYIGQYHVYPHIYLSISIYLYIYLSTYLYIYLSIYLYIYVSIYILIWSLI